MPHSTHKKIVRCGAVYDIVAMAPFALPVVSAWAYLQIQWVDRQLGFDSQFSPLDPTAMFLLNIGAWSYLIWGGLRLRTPSLDSARFSALLRVIVVALQLFAVSNGASPFLLVLGAIQLLLAVAEVPYWWSKFAKASEQSASSY